MIYTDSGFEDPETRQFGFWVFDCSRENKEVKKLGSHSTELFLWLSKYGFGWREKPHPAHHHSTLSCISGSEGPRLSSLAKSHTEA